MLVECHVQMCCAACFLFDFFSCFCFLSPNPKSVMCNVHTHTHTHTTVLLTFTHFHRLPILTTTLHSLFYCGGYSGTVHGSSPPSAAFVTYNISTSSGYHRLCCE